MTALELGRSRHERLRFVMQAHGALKKAYHAATAKPSKQTKKFKPERAK